MVTSEESHPKKASGDDGKEREQRQETLRFSQLSLFDLAPRFEDFMVDLDFPTLAIPLDTFEGIGKEKKRNRGEEKPAKGVNASRWVFFLCQDDKHGTVFHTTA